MSDKYIQIASFKYGLDTRREELVSQPGVLATAENCHINAGGELVKRKAFVADDVPFPTNTFGLQDTDAGLRTFGSDANPNATLPTGVTYQRLLPAFLITDVETLSLSGTPSVDGVYPRSGVQDGKGFYGALTTKYIVWQAGSTRWMIRQVIATVDTLMYQSHEHVDRPDQVVTWTPVGSTVNPQPTFVRTTAAIAQMTKVIYSCNFLGKAFVIAQFGDVATGTHIFTFCFYDGEVVPSSRNGIVLIDGGGNVEDPSDLSDDLADQVNAISGWTGIANHDVTNPVTVPDTTFASAGATIIESPPGISFEPVILDADGNPLWDSTAGVMTRRLSDRTADGTGEEPAKAAFTLTGGTPGTVDVQAPYNADGTGNATLIAAPINFITSLAVTAGLVVDAINAKTSLHGYSASLSGATVTVTAPDGFGAVTFNLTVITTLSVTATMGVTPIIGGMSMTFNPNTIYAIFNWDGGSSPTSTVIHVAGCNVKVKNGVAPITYEWKETDPSGTTLMPGASGITVSSATSPSVGFHATLLRGQKKTGYWRCTVHSAAATPVDVPAVLQVTIGVT